MQQLWYTDVNKHHDFNGCSVVSASWFIFSYVFVKKKASHSNRHLGGCVCEAERLVDYVFPASFYFQVKSGMSQRGSVVSELLYLCKWFIISSRELDMLVLEDMSVYELRLCIQLVIRLIHYVSELHLGVVVLKYRL